MFYDSTRGPPPKPARTWLLVDLKVSGAEGQTLSLRHDNGDYIFRKRDLIYGVWGSEFSVERGHRRGKLQRPL